MSEFPGMLGDFAGQIARISLDSVWLGLAALALSAARLWTPRWRLVLLGAALLRLTIRWFRKFRGIRRRCFPPAAVRARF